MPPPVPEPAAGDDVRRAQTLRAFADVLIPGDGEFPAASAAGAHGLLVERLRETGGPEAVAALADMLDRAGEAPFLDLDAARRVDAVRAVELAEPAMFALARSILSFSYYQHPLVVAAIRGMGFAYNDAPQPLGYLRAMAPFDPRRNLPSVPRGGYKATDAIVRLDVTIDPADLATPEQSR